MNTFKQYETTLELAEYVAEMENAISSEQELSDRFDEMLAECNFFETYDRDDLVAVREEFNNWSDGLCEEGEIHEAQYNEYEYVGDFA